MEYHNDLDSSDLSDRIAAANAIALEIYDLRRKVSYLQMENSAKDAELAIQQRQMGHLQERLASAHEALGCARTQLEASNELQRRSLEIIEVFKIQNVNLKTALARTTKVDGGQATYYGSALKQELGNDIKIETLTDSPLNQQQLKIESLCVQGGDSRMPGTRTALGAQLFMPRMSAESVSHKSPTKLDPSCPVFTPKAHVTPWIQTDASPDDGPILTPSISTDHKTSPPVDRVESKTTEKSPLQIKEKISVDKPDNQKELAEIPQGLNVKTEDDVRTPPRSGSSIKISACKIPGPRLPPHLRSVHRRSIQDPHFVDSKVSAPSTETTIPTMMLQPPQLGVVDAIKNTTRPLPFMDGHEDIEATTNHVSAAQADILHPEIKSSPQEPDDVAQRSDTSSNLRQNAPPKVPDQGSERHVIGPKQGNRTFDTSPKFMVSDILTQFTSSGPIHHLPSMGDLAMKIAQRVKASPIPISESRNPISGTRILGGDLDDETRALVLYPRHDLTDTSRGPDEWRRWLPKFMVSSDGTSRRVYTLSRKDERGVGLMGPGVAFIHE